MDLDKIQEFEKRIINEIYETKTKIIEEKFESLGLTPSSDIRCATYKDDQFLMCEQYFLKETFLFDLKFKMIDNKIVSYYSESVDLK